MDKLDEMFFLRMKFMETLSKKVPDAYPQNFPLDIKKKSDQQFCRDIALRGVEEMFEALQHLKNWKPHKLSEDESFNHDEFLEEIVDAFNYFFSLILLTGYTCDDLFEAYVKKDKIIHERLNTGY